MDKYAKIEFMDRISIMECNFDDFIRSHRSFKETSKKFKKIAKKTAKKLGKLYQEAENL